MSGDTKKYLSVVWTGARFNTAGGLFPFRVRAEAGTLFCLVCFSVKLKKTRVMTHVKMLFTSVKRKKTPHILKVKYCFLWISWVSLLLSLDFSHLAFILHWTKWLTTLSTFCIYALCTVQKTNTESKNMFWTLLLGQWGHSLQWHLRHLMLTHSRAKVIT